MSSNSNIEVPWEPYKAAASKKLKESYLSSKYDLAFLNDKSNLIKYKIDTNLDKFNSNRPGYQFDDFDFKLIEDKVNLEESLSEIFAKAKLNKLSNNLSTSLANDFNNSDAVLNKIGPSFIDARFYTDANFIRLANQLKKKSINQSTIINKPVNVVGPNLVDSKINQKKDNDSVKNVDASSIKLWKNQCEQYEAQISYLEDQMKGINEQLQIQTQVNAELKKMLIASVGGEDLQYKLERLINDKQRYEFELENRNQQILKLNEELEQVSIQCDLWRSKYLASRLLADENITWKSFLLMINSQHEILIRNLLQDNDLLNLKLSQAYDLSISLLNKKKDNSNNIPSKNKNKYFNNLQSINLILSNLCSLNQTINQSNKNDLISDLNNKLTLLNQKINTRSKTINELSAEQALEQFDWVKTTVKKNQSNINMIDTLDSLEDLIKSIKKNRSHKFSRLYQPESVGDSNILINCCTNCKGEIKTV